MALILDKEHTRTLREALSVLADAKHALLNAIALSFVRDYKWQRAYKLAYGAFWVAKGAVLEGDDMCAREMLAKSRCALQKMETIESAYAGIDKRCQDAWEAYQAISQNLMHEVDMLDTCARNTQFAEATDMFLERAPKVARYLDALEARA